MIGNLLPLTWKFQAIGLLIHYIYLFGWESSGGSIHRAEIVSQPLLLCEGDFYMHKNQIAAPEEAALKGDARRSSRFVGLKGENRYPYLSMYNYT